MAATVRPDRRAGDSLLADELFSALGLLRRTARRAAGRPWPVSELSASQLELLRLIRRQPGISVAEAAAELGLVPNTVSTLVRQLVDADQIVRTPDAGDRRIARLDLTASARQRVERWRDQRSELAARAIAELGADDRAALVRAVPIMTALAAQMGSQ